jgi:hypothetical protein
MKSESPRSNINEANEVKMELQANISQQDLKIKEL